MARAERVTRSARHETGQIGLPLQHLRGRQPVGPFRLALDRLDAGPGEAVAADADAVTDGPAAAENKIEVGMRRIDNHRAWRFAARILDNLPPQPSRNVSVALRPERPI